MCPVNVPDISLVVDEEDLRQDLPVEAAEGVWEIDYLMPSTDGNSVVGFDMSRFLEPRRLSFANPFTLRDMLNQDIGFLKKLKLWYKACRKNKSQSTASIMGTFVIINGGIQCAWGIFNHHNLVEDERYNNQIELAAEISS